MNTVTNYLTFASITNGDDRTNRTRQRRQHRSRQQQETRSTMILTSIVVLLLCLPISFVCASRQPAFVRIPFNSRTAPFLTPSSTMYFDRQHRYQPSNSTGGTTMMTNMIPPQSPSPVPGTSSTELASARMDVADIATRNVQKTFKVYCDMDGVLVDFEKGVVRLLNVAPSKLVKGTMWKTIARAPHFFENLEWTQDGRRLWQSIRHLKPDILTGVPYPKTSRVEKFNWCKRELGLEEAHFVDYAAGYKDHECVNGNTPKEGSTNIITCWSSNKYKEARNGS